MKMQGESDRSTMDRAQFRQTIICTAAVGAVLGLVPALGSIAIRSERVAGPEGFLDWLLYAMNLAGVLVGSVIFCVLVFGMLPMLLQAGFVKLARLWTGRA
ncbi:hypothetical protein [Marilutibacter maris]|uniref:Serine/threonine protein kinase n=1 Tax=Marilutibacter maris TaxID=1605891 RepID=A0A2U9TEB5_9GAMM|nr:hypothetical protein [Lysobacter maris]AWV08828.1 serine/threonine protein kinase [Lysobacter maris]